MKVLVLFLSALFLSMVALADIPFTAEAFHQSQKNEEKIVLHFFADWCPTCKAQKKSLAQLDQEGFLKNVTVYTVDYDKEVAFKKEMNVTEQSTFILFYGANESGRVTGITSPADIKAFFNEKLINLTLNDQLTLTREAFARKVPADKAKMLADATNKLRESHLAEKALKVGQTMPNFSLPDAQGKMVSLKDLRQKGAVIVTFYRGSWCPFCNLQLHSYQEHLAEFKAKGATLVAITPEKPDLTLLLEQNKKLEFPVLTDAGNKVAKKFGLAFKVDAEVKKMYKQFGVDLEKSQGNAEWQLPVPATYVISKSGKIIYAFVDVDYTHRADPKDILNALK